MITNEGLIRNLQVGEPFSDHISIIFEVKISPSKNPSRKKVYKFADANLDRRNELFNIVPWTCHGCAFLTNDVQQNWLMLKDLFFTAVEACIPTKSPRKMKNAPWLTPDVLKLIRQKRIVYKRAKASNSGNLWTRYRNLKNRTKKAGNQARWEYLKN